MHAAQPPNGAAHRPFGPAPAKAVSILVADPHPIVRAGVRTVLGAHPDMAVAGESGCGPEAVESAQRLGADLVVCEVALLRCEGLAARLHADGRKVLVLTAADAPRAVRLALEAGATGYVLKRSAVEQLVRAVRAVSLGGTYLDPELAGRVVAGYVGGNATPVVELSDREEQVLKLLARGFSNKEIASKLSLSVKTVETYKARTMEKLGVRTRVGLVQYAVDRGWLGVGGPEPAVVESTAQ